MDTDGEAPLVPNHLRVNAGVGLPPTEGLLTMKAVVPTGMTSCKILRRSILEEVFERLFANNH